MGNVPGGGRPTAADGSDELAYVMNKLRAQDYITQYNATTEKCFKRCVFNLRTPQFVEKEEVCLQRCIEKMAHFHQHVEKKVGLMTAGGQGQQQQQQQMAEAEGERELKEGEAPKK